MDDNPDIPIDGALPSAEDLERIASAFYSEAEPNEAEMVDNHRLDHLYTHPFKNGAGKYFTVVSADKTGTPDVVDAEGYEAVRNKVKTRLTFIKSDEGGHIKEIELKRFKYYKKEGYVPQEEGITFSFPYFVYLIGFLQSIAKLNLNDITERRIPLHNSPTLDAQTIKQFHTLVATNQGQDLVREVVKNGELLGSDIVNIAYRKAQLEVFEKLLSGSGAIEEYRTKFNIKKSGDEPVWQHFFEANAWIFGYGLSFVFNQPLEGKKLETTIKGSDIAGKGKRTDALLKTMGIINSLCLVEIKTPKTELLDSEPYRPVCWNASKELSGGIAQAQKTVQKTLENIGSGIRPTKDDGTPTGEVLYSYRPKSFLLIGKLSEFDTPTGINSEKFASFELLRRSTLSPEIITFDELLERARFIVSNF